MKQHFNLVYISLLLYGCAQEATNHSQNKEFSTGHQTDGSISISSAVKSAVKIDETIKLEKEQGALLGNKNSIEFSVYGAVVGKNIDNFRKINPEISVKKLEPTHYSPMPATAYSLDNGSLRIVVNEPAGLVDHIEIYPQKNEKWRDVFRQILGNGSLRSIEKVFGHCKSTSIDDSHKDDPGDGEYYYRQKGFYIQFRSGACWRFDLLPPMPIEYGPDGREIQYLPNGQPVLGG